MSVETDVQALKEEVKELTGEVHTLQRQASSRRGPEGGRGLKVDKGDPGPMGVVSEAEVTAALQKVLDVDAVAEAIVRRVDIGKIVRETWLKQLQKALAKS